MKKILIASIVLSIPFANSAFSSDYLMAIGAGGEEEKADTIFDQSIKSLADYVKRSPGLKANVAFNGGHSVTEGIVQNEFPDYVGKSGFLATDYQRLIQSYKTKLENNEMGPGDQFMIFIDSHGAEKESQFKTHEIATAASGATNLNTLAGAQVVDLDQLEVLKKLAKDKGVKMAIIDASCHSGNTLALADDNTCVISSTGPNHYGYSSFSPNFINAMTKGKNLEEVFLDSRANDSAPELPMISTNAGLAVNNTLYDKITPYLYHFDPKDDKLLPYLQTHNSEEQLCIANQNFKSMMDTIDSIENLQTKTQNFLWWKWTQKTKDIDLSDLKTLLTNYKSSLDIAAIRMRELDVDRLKNTETIQVHSGYENYTIDYSRPVTWEDMLNSDYDKLIDQMNLRIRLEPNADVKTSYLGTLSFYTQAKAKKDEILRANPDLSSITSKQEELKKSIDSTYEINRKIAAEERKLYQALYKKYQKNENAQTRNACQNFKI